jgi:hypothetical protein
MSHLFFSDIFCKCVYLNVVYDSHMCYKWFIGMLHMFCNGFSSVFTSVTNPCFKCFICLYKYVANVLSGCFKFRLGVAHIARAPVAGDSGLPLGLGSYLAPSSHGVPRPLLSLSPLPSLPFPLSRRGGSSSVQKRRGTDGLTCGQAAWVG